MVVERYCENCARCIQRKAQSKLSHIHSMDCLSLEPDSKNICNVLVVSDHDTQYASAFAARAQKALTVDKVIWEPYFVHMGYKRECTWTKAEILNVDSFNSWAVKHVRHKEIQNNPLTPSGDPQPEWFNRALLDKQGTPDSNDKSKWSRNMSHLLHAHNCTLNESTGFTPYLLMFGQEDEI